MRYPLKPILALIFICFAWGTTYLAIKVGVTSWPPFLYAGLRQAASGLILIFLAMGISRKADLSWANVKHQLICGFLMITMGNGLVTWGEKFIPSGVAALICGLMPVCAVMINLGINKEERLNLLIAIGTIVGFAGVALNFKDSLAQLGTLKYMGGIAATFCATSCWALGSIINKKKKTTVNPIFNAGLQLGFGGLIMLAISPVTDNYSTADFGNTNALWSLVYLVIIGSVLAFTAYLYVLKNLPVGIVLLYAYINPLVAVILGYWLLSEVLTIYTAISFVAIMFGVFLVNKGYKQQNHVKPVLSPLEK